jgi:hypothetical protein
MFIGCITKLVQHLQLVTEIMGRLQLSVCFLGSFNFSPFPLIVWHWLVWPGPLTQEWTGLCNSPKCEWTPNLLENPYFSQLRSINYEILLIESFPTIIKTSTIFSLKNDFDDLEFSMKFNNSHIVSLTLGNHLSASLGSLTVSRAHKTHHGLEDLNMTNKTNKLSLLIDRCVVPNSLPPAHNNINKPRFYFVSIL